MHNRLVFAKPPLSYNIQTESIVPTPLQNDFVIIDQLWGPVDVNWLFRDIYDAAAELKHYGLTPLFVELNTVTYEQLLVNNYIRVGVTSLDKIFDLFPIINDTLKDREFQVKCSARDEIIYKQELKKIRMR